MDPLGTDITKVAGAYSTFAGVLAGFVFAVMGYLLSNRSRTSQSEVSKAFDPALSWSILAFVSLSFASFLFALLSGDDRFASLPNGAVPGPTRVRPLVLHIVGSGVLTTALLVLLLALNWLFTAEGTSRALFWQLRLVTYLTGLMTLFYFYGTFDSVAIMQGQYTGNSLLYLIPLGLVTAVAVTAGELVGMLLRKDKSYLLVDSVRVATQTTFVLLVFACGGFFYALDNADNATASGWNVQAYEWWGIGVLGFILFFSILNLPSRHARMTTQGDRSG